MPGLIVDSLLWYAEWVTTNSGVRLNSKRLECLVAEDLCVIKQCPNRFGKI